LGPDGSNSLATWRTSSTAASGCRPDAVAGTHQAPQARPSPGWARKVPASTLLHVGRRRRCRPAPPRATTSAPGDVASGSSLARPSPEGPRLGPDLGRWIPAAATEPQRPAALRRRETNLPHRASPAASTARRHAEPPPRVRSTVHRRLTASPAWGGPAPGRRRATAAGTARALPGGSRRRRQRGEGGGGGTGG
jgi:hypothetical protein